MLNNILLYALIGVAGVILVDKWKIDDFMNVRGVKFWPRNPCNLCRAFWFGAISCWLLALVPELIYVFLPLSAIPLQKIIGKLSN